MCLQLARVGINSRSLELAADAVTSAMACSGDSLRNARCRHGLGRMTLSVVTMFAVRER